MAYCKNVTTGGVLPLETWLIGASNFNRAKESDKLWLLLSRFIRLGDSVSATPCDVIDVSNPVSMPYYSTAQVQHCTCRIIRGRKFAGDTCFNCESSSHDRRCKDSQLKWVPCPLFSVLFYPM